MEWFTQYFSNFWDGHERKARARHLLEPPAQGRPSLEESPQRRQGY